MRALRFSYAGVLCFNHWPLVSIIAVLGTFPSPARCEEDGTSAVIAASTDAAPAADLIIVDTSANEPADSVNTVITVSPADSGNAGQPNAGPKLSKAELDALATPTHHQTGVISINVPALPQRSVKCFCLAPDGRILAGCAGGKGEIRVFDDTGKFVESWSAPFEAEAIYARADGAIFIAGEGKLARLSPAGQLEFEHDAPHVAAINSNPDRIREEVIASAKQQAESYAQQARIYDQMIEQADKQIAKIKEQMEAADQQASAAAGNDGEQTAAAKAQKTAARRAAANKQSLERRLATQERMKQQYDQAKTQWAKMIEENPVKELTEDQIAERVKSSIQYKLQASSVSATDSAVFLATHAAAGYGFEVWRTDPQFENGERIVTGLSGCCGQMDCKISADGLYVAENSRHRVCHYDRDGKLIGTFGFSARSGIEGFGSCCNPMNVAFGPEGAIYTSEDDTGRIKRYSPDGKLLGLVGAVEVPPGCKNVSIAVNADGSRVYMLDITRSRIVQMEPYTPGESPGPMKFEDKNAPAAGDGESTLQSSNDAGGSLTRGLMRMLGIGK